MLKLYGIPNCNTVTKAMDWLKKNDIPFEFHNYKKKGISEEKLKEWISQIGWEKLVNKRGTTWKSLDEALQQNIINDASAITLMISKNSVIKRPLIETNNTIATIGYDEKEYENAFI